MFYMRIFLRVLVASCACVLTLGSVSAQDQPQMPGPAVYRPGGDVVAPTVVKEVRPRYTAKAQKARIQGTVLLEAVVRADGTVGDVKVVRSLDQTYGLDRESIAAVKQWRFKPGTKNGKAVPVRVEIETSFTLK